MCLVSLTQQAEQTISAVPDFFYEKLLRKCNWTKPAPLTMPVSDLRSEQPAPNLHYLIYGLLICVILQIGAHVTVHVGARSLPEVLHRDVKWLCHLNTSGLTRTTAPARLFPWWPRLPWGPQQRPPSPASAPSSHSQPGGPGFSAGGWARQLASRSCGTTASRQQLTRQRWPQNAVFNCSSSTKNRAWVVPEQQTVSHVSVALIIL